MAVPNDTLEQHLAHARQLIPSPLLVDSGEADNLAQCEEMGYNHLWMGVLQDVGWFAQENGRDSELPAEFWARVAAAAHGMKFPEFVPYCLGKALGLPRRDVPDLMAAFATMPVALGPGWRAQHGDLAGLCDQAADLLRTVDPVAGALIDAGALEPLSSRLMESDALDRVGNELSALFTEAFDELFQCVTVEDFPEEHADHAWAVIATNPFAVELGEGLMATTYAQVWWRAS